MGYISQHLTWNSGAHRQWRSIKIGHASCLQRLLELGSWFWTLEPFGIFKDLWAFKSVADLRGIHIH